MSQGAPARDHTVRWDGHWLTSTETCTLRESGAGAVLEGDVELPLRELPTAIRYLVEVDDRWRTRATTIDVTAAGATRRHMLTCTDGAWTVDGVTRPDLDGCLDVDLGFSPCTNTLPVRRLDLAVGASGTIAAAWVTIPDLVVERSTQTYSRTTEHTFRYESDGFAAELLVDSHGLVRTYGDDLWVRAEGS